MLKFDGRKIVILTAEGLSYLTAFLIPFYFFRFHIFVVPTNILELSVVLFLASVIIKTKFSGRSFDPGSLIAYAIILITFLVALVSDDRQTAFGIFKGWFLIPALYYLAIINFYTKETLYKFSIPIYFSLMIVAIWAILQKVGIITTLFYQNSDPTFNQYLQGNFRVFGPFESPNYLAMFLLPMLYLTLPLLKYFEGKKIKFLYLFSLALPLLAIFYSGSRAGIIALGLSLIIYFGIFDQKISVKSNIIKISLALIILLSLAAYIAQINLDPGSDSIRIQIYKYSFEILRIKWSCGVGLGGFYREIGQISSNVESFRTHALPYAIHPHNLFLALWLNLGIVGFSTFIVFIVHNFYLLLKYLRSSVFFASLFLSLLAIIIHGLFDTTYFKNDLSIIFWLIIGLIYLLQRKEENFD